MSSFGDVLIDVSDRYQVMFGSNGPRYDKTFVDIANPILLKLASGDAPYHTVDHTLKVILSGQAILEGKQHYEGSVSPKDWLNMLVSLLCHDIGYVKGLCEGDRPRRHQYIDGNGGYVYLTPESTGAALSEYHVARSQAYVATQLANHPDVKISDVQWNIEMTRFPVPEHARYQDTLSYGGLCRAADLLGQLSDPQYMQKLCALFDEFEETGMNQTLGYTTPVDLRVNYPNFYRHVVHPYIQASLRYLNVTAFGRKCIAQLYTNIRLAKLVQLRTDVTTPRLKQLSSEAELVSWQEAGFTFT
ncbi:MAG: metal-dependent phosphohydrolase [Leptolyngbya sp. SIO1D8]|nr:metal-dependent phosphohydrolase [Leptolyngbya sp. SIO1D8]